MVTQSFGRFEVLGRIGSGAFATVLLAYDAALDAPVALKVLADNHSFDPELRERFVREARLLRRLAADPRAAERLVAVHDVAEEDGRPYLVLEYFPRGSLTSRLNMGLGPVGAHTLRRVADELMACLDVVHQHGVTHRDVTPSNLLIRGGRSDVQMLLTYGEDHPTEGVVSALAELSRSLASPSQVLAAEETLVLADFGLARGAHQTTLTVASGTPGYSAPEHLRATTEVKPSADLYAATAVLIAAACGSPMLPDAARRHFTGRDLKTIDRCLAEDPAKRPEDAAAWRAAIDPILDGLAAFAREEQQGDPTPRPGHAATSAIERPASSGGLASSAGSASSHAMASSSGPASSESSVSSSDPASSGRASRAAARTRSVRRARRRRRGLVASVVAAVVGLAAAGVGAAFVGGSDAGSGGRATSGSDGQVSAGSDDTAGAVSPGSTGDDGAPRPVVPGTTGGTAVAGAVGPLATDGAEIVDSTGQPVQLRGVNWIGLDGSQCLPAGLSSVSLDDLLAETRGKGFAMIRLPYSNVCLTARSLGANPSLNPALVNRTGAEVIDEVVKSAGRHGLRVLLSRRGADASDDGALWFSEKVPESKWISDWVGLAKRYRNNPTVVGADLHNEPHGAACWGCDDRRYNWAAAATRAGDAILAANPDWLIVVQGVEKSAQGWFTWWGSDLSTAKTKPVTLSVPGRLVYSAHDYPGTVFEQPWFNDPTYPKNLAGVWQRNWGFHVDAGEVPVLLGAFGTAYETEQDRQWLQSLVAYLDKRNISFAYSNLTPAETIGGVYDVTKRAWNQPKLDAMKPLLVSS
ncbi:MAG: cellulase family glycosylhydrolase [Dermatophilaceae bacterium]